MPYRAELKRPDLKGSFPCSVCGKIFCHSSSLSRHRMQAHFKSYVCTQCNAEISSNETLRSHMFRAHSISRIFMCRCCNWAFPDKTSLHIHMQSMLRNGDPGEVAVLARSSTEGDPPFISGEHPSPSRTPISIEFSMNNNTPNIHHPTALQINSIFPANTKPDLLLARMNAQTHFLSTEASSIQRNWLNSWVCNNPFSAALQQRSANLLLNSGTLRNSAFVEPTSLKTGLPPRADDSTMDKPESTATEVTVIEDASRKRKLNLEEDTHSFTPHLKMVETETPTSYTHEDIDEMDKESVEQQPSPTASDSHSSGSSEMAETIKCFDCQHHKEKLNESELRVRDLESKVVGLQNSLSHLSRQIMLSKGLQKQEQPLLPIAQVPFLNPEAVNTQNMQNMQTVFDNLLNWQSVLQQRPRC